KVVGVYGGLQIGAVTAFMDGFYYGAKAYEAETGTPVTVVGWDATTQKGDFIGGFAPNDAAGKTIAAGQIQAGADVLLPVGGDQFGALSEAISEAGVDAKMIGVDKNWSLLDRVQGQDVDLYREAHDPGCIRHHQGWRS
ncbi:MAG: hypothetical protein EBQ79_00170, partial [Actinobacteria bacterium]|nr:hypothetical protein [Actinomycetota bacterium]